MPVVHKLIYRFNVIPKKQIYNYTHTHAHIFEKHLPNKRHKKYTKNSCNSTIRNDLILKNGQKIETDIS